MRMNKATVLAILAFTTSTLAQSWDSYSYGNDLEARDAEPEADFEFDEEELYARDAEPEFEYDEEAEFQLSARDEAYLDGYLQGLGKRQNGEQKNVLNQLAKDDKKDAAALNKSANDQKLKSQHDAESARLAKLNVAKDQSAIDALLAKLHSLEGKMKTDKATYQNKRHKSHREAKKSKDLKKQADAKTAEAAALTTRDLLEDLYDEYDY